MLKDIFANLNLDKEMLFDDGQKLTFDQALQNLQSKLGIKKKEVDINAISEKLSSMLSKISTGLYTESFSLSSVPEFAIFCGWVGSIHNIHLIPHEDQRFPNNIFFDILASTRNKFDEGKFEPQSTDHVFRFILEGLNARKIEKGKVPGTTFIASSLALSVIAGIKAEKKSIFFQTYSGITAFKRLQTRLENEYTGLSVGDGKTAFSRLSTDKTSSGHPVLNIDNLSRASSGACIYDTEKAVGLAGKLRLDPSELEHLTARAVDILDMFDESFSQLEANEEVQDLAMWDASDWIWRLYVIAKIGGQEERIANFKIIDTIAHKCEKGDFNANQREVCLGKDDITKPFQQFHLSAEEMEEAYKTGVKMSPLAKHRTTLLDKVSEATGQPNHATEASNSNN